MSTLKASMGVLMALLLATSGCTQLQRQINDRVNGGGPGSHYEAYLGGSASTLVVELDHSPGARWDMGTDAQKDFVAQLEKITAKEVVVRTSQDLPDNGKDYAYSIEQLRQLHEEHQDIQPDADTVVMHALFLDGEFQGNVAGLAYATKAFAIFKGEIEEKTCRNDQLVCSGVKNWKVMRSVAIHEAGHLFGLVNSPLPMQTPHEMTRDPNPDTAKNEGEAHSKNEDSVMYWKVEASGGLSDLIGGGEVPWRFDSNDLEDARAVRQGG